MLNLRGVRNVKILQPTQMFFFMFINVTFYLYTFIGFLVNKLVEWQPIMWANRIKRRLTPLKQLPSDMGRNTLQQNKPDQRCCKGSQVFENNFYSLSLIESERYRGLYINERERELELARKLYFTWIVVERVRETERDHPHPPPQKVKRSKVCT